MRIRVRSDGGGILMAEYIIDTTDGIYNAHTTGELVRCGDCKRFSLDNSDHDYRSGWWCHRWNTDMVEPDGFCAWASRKESE